MWLSLTGHDAKLIDGIGGSSKASLSKFVNDEAKIYLKGAGLLCSLVRGTSPKALRLQPSHQKPTATTSG